MPNEQQLAETILRLLAARSGSICPSDAARAAGDEDWRTQMEPVRAAARALANEGRVEITQGGDVVDPATARGPIRIRRPL